MTLKKFRKIVWDFYREEKRSLPWRKTRDPYKILVSEIMLQQTQVERVKTKYQEFLKTFPTIKDLAQAPLREVLIVWQGLGYNRRAKMLKRAAEAIFLGHGGRVPKEYAELIKLPGVGNYTAGAVLAFAYNKPVVIIETNIRAVFIDAFFKNKEKVDDAELLPLIQKTLDTKNPREWYAALMDYGATIKKQKGNPNKKSKHHTRQKTFKGSLRQVRGAIVRILTKENNLSKKELLKKLNKKERIEDTEKIHQALKSLVKENLIHLKKNNYLL